MRPVDPAYPVVLSAILDLVPATFRSRVLALFRSIGVEFNHEKSKEKVKSALRGMKGIPAPVINTIEACCIVGKSSSIAGQIRT